MTIVTCDFVLDVAGNVIDRKGEKPWCPNDFRSASLKSMIPIQLEAAGWKQRQIGDHHGGRVRQDLCPEHAHFAETGIKMPDVAAHTSSG